jgi:cytochrome c556
MKRVLPFALLLAACAPMADAPAPAPEPAAPSPSAAELVAARQAGMAMSGAALASRKAAIDTGAEPRTRVFPARGLSKWAHAAPALFAPGAMTETSKARPEVWTDRDGFLAAAAAFQAQADSLLAAAEANDAAAFSTRWTSTQRACGACHDKYRVKDD